MGFLDKVKESAATATAAAKSAAEKGQAKLEDAQAKKAADALLRDLGALAYASQTGRATGTTEADIERIMGALQQFEAQHGPLKLDLESPAGAATTPPPAGAPAQPDGGAPAGAAPQAAPPPAAAAPPPPPAGQTL